MLDASYRICWSIDSWVSTLREAQDSWIVGYDFETCPDRFHADYHPKKGRDGKPSKCIPSALRPEDGARIAGIAISWLDTNDRIRSAYAPIRHDPRFAGGDQLDPLQVCKAFSDFIADRPADRYLVVHNLMMELSCQLAENIVWPKEGQLHDIQIAARVLNRGVGFQELIGLKPLQAEVLKRDMGSKNDLDRWLKAHRFKPGRDIWRAPAPLAGWYAQDDARDTLEICLKWWKLIHQPPTRWWWHRAPDRSQRLDLYELEIRAAIEATISCMRGTRYDAPFCRRQGRAAEVLQSIARDWIRGYLGMPALNPGSQTQLRGVLFGTRFNFEVSLEHTTESFKKLPEREQASTIAGHGKAPLVSYASLDVDALKYYESKYIEHADLLFMLAVYRKCSTAISWFDDRVLQFGVRGSPDPWWNSDAGSYLNLMFHRLRTVGTGPGRMSSSDYNAQQVPKRLKMLLNAARLFRILEEVMHPSRLNGIMSILIRVPCKEGDEAKVLGLQPGDEVVDFSIRRMFISRPEFNLRTFDLSQVEMRGFAHYTGNRLLCNGYGPPLANVAALAELDAVQALMEEREPDWSNVDVERHVRMEENEFDIHGFVSDELSISRKGGKGINFGLVYGMGEKKLARGLGWSPGDGKLYLARYHAKFPEIRQMQGKIVIALRSRGYVFDPFGRRYYLPVARAYVGLNRLIQGWAATAFKVGFVRTSEVFRSPGFGGGSIDSVTGLRRSDGARILTCIHDEQMGEIHRSLDNVRTDWVVRSCMTNLFGLNVPLASSSERSDGPWDNATGVSAKLPV
jgi:hypothetical protein